MEFAEGEGDFVDRCCSSKDVGQDLVKLRQLNLLADFKQCVHAEITTLDKRKLDQ